MKVEEDLVDLKKIEQFLIASLLPPMFIFGQISGTYARVDSTNTLAANIEIGYHPWTVAVNPNTNRVYVVNYESPLVSVIDGSTDSLVGIIKVGDDPRAVAVNQNTNKSYVANWGSNSISVIDEVTKTP